MAAEMLVFGGFSASRIFSGGFSASGYFAASSAEIRRLAGLYTVLCVRLTRGLFS